MNSPKVFDINDTHTFAGGVSNPDIEAMIPQEAVPKSASSV